MAAHPTPTPNPLHAPSWLGKDVPPDQLRREILNLYALVRELQEKLAANGID